MMTFRGIITTFAFIVPFISGACLDCMSNDSGMGGSSVNGTNATSSLDVYLFDFFGDGWDGAKQYAEYPDGSIQSWAPDCDVNPLRYNLCPTEEGLYYLVVQHEDETYTPEHYWEIFWTVSVENCTSGEVTTYTGGYNTTMVWNYESDTDEWTLVYWENLIPNEAECDACGDAKKCKPKPKKKKSKKKKKVIRNKKNGKGKSDDDVGRNRTDDNRSDDNRGSTYSEYITYRGKGDDDVRRNRTDDNRSDDNRSDDNRSDDNRSDDNRGDDNRGDDNRGSDDDHSRYGPPAVNVRVTMYDEEGDGWWQTDYLGTSWYISDYARTYLFHSGTLCDGYSGMCKLCLGDGSYIFRVTGENYNNTDFQSWDFCGVTGEYSEELAFHVKKGKCIADSITSLESICYENVTSTVTVIGTLAVSGVPTELMGSAASNIIAHSLGAAVSGWGENSVSVLSTSVDRSLLEGRRLSSFTHDIQFEVSFSPEKAYNVDGRDYAALSDLVDELADTIDTVISSGAILKSLTAAAKLANVVDIAGVQSLELLKLEIGSVVFSGTEEMKYSEFPAQYDEDYGSDVVVNKYSYTNFALFLGALAVGFVAFVGIFSKSMTPYNKVAMDSEHGSVEVTSMEMDSTLDNINGAAERVDNSRPTL